MGILTTLIIQPFYNALILLMDFVVPNLGVSIIILTIIFRLILFPLSKKQIKTQIKMREIQEPLKDLKKKYKDKPEEMGKKMMELYKEHDINPFSGILLMLIQFPLLIGYYYVFLRSGLPEINLDLLYSFVPQPEVVDTIFLGFIDLTSKSVILALLAGAAQYIQISLLMPKDDGKKVEGKGEMMEGVMKNVQTQMKYVMPIIMLFIAYSFGSIIALYFLISSLFSIGQEVYMRKKVKAEKVEVTEATL